jgi:hypothetical protein
VEPNKLSMRSVATFELGRTELKCSTSCWATAAALVGAGAGVEDGTAEVAEDGTVEEGRTAEGTTELVDAPAESETGLGAPEDTTGAEEAVEGPAGALEVAGEAESDTAAGALETAGNEGAADDTTGAEEPTGAEAAGTEDTAAADSPGGAEA